MNKLSILLRKRNKVLLAEGSATLSLSLLATAVKNLQSLGFTCSAPLLDRMSTQEEGTFVQWFDELLTELRQRVGAHVSYEPMYPNFPKQVMEMEEAELYLNALLHYLGDVVGLRILPVSEREERPSLQEEGKLTVLELGTEEEFVQIGRKLIGANSSISAEDKEILGWYVQEYRDRLGLLLPESIPYKENLSVVAMLLLKHTTRPAQWLGRYVQTATDVLRLAVAMSEGDVSLASVTRFRSFKRSERRLLLGLLEECRGRTEDMLRYRGRWKRLGERLHPGEYKKQFPQTAVSFDVLRKGLPYTTFRAEVEEALKSGDPAKALELLKSRPGELARRLDHLLRLCQPSPSGLLGALKEVLGGEGRGSRDEVAAAILETFAEVVGEVATPVLLQVMTHFLHRNEERALRSFFPKGNAAKVITVENTLVSLPQERCDRVVGLCRKALLKRFGARESLGKVFVDESLRAHLVPFSQRSASRALRTLVRGSSLDMPAGGTIRFFVWWKEGVLGGKDTGRVDLDLSAVMYDEEWNYKEHISYTNLRSAKYRSAHSGDITSAPDGACEFIDLDIDSITAFGGRYVIPSVLSYTGQPFVCLPECHAGWMMREEPESGEIFEPSTVVDKIDIAADTKVVIPMILDLKERKMIWTDLALRSHPAWDINVESNQRGFVAMGKALTTLVKPDLYTLFSLHAEARGERVDNPEEADQVFSLTEGTTPFEIEEIMAEYLA